MKKKPASKKNKIEISKIIKQDILKPLSYNSKKDIDFISAVISYFKWHFSDDDSITENTITDWWKLRIVCIRNKKITNQDEEGWLPDMFAKKCFIETYFIKGESNEEWQERKKNLCEFYSQSIAIYQEAIFASTVRRITPTYKNKIIEHYLKNKDQEQKINKS